jgi:sigma-B regulation protein RsbU (phosphoserine phosphatase)
MGPNATISLELVRHHLAADTPYQFVAFALITIALAGFASAAIRREHDVQLLSFSTFAMLYGIRLWMQGSTASLIFHHAPVYERLHAAIDFTVPIPGMLYFYRSDFLDRIGKPLAAIVAAVCFTLFVLALTFGRNEAFYTINNAVVVIALLQFLFSFGLRKIVDRDLRIVRFGLLTFVVLALFDNIVGLMKRDFLHIEPFGFFVFIACLGYVTATRTFTRERRLLSIEKELDIARRIQMSILPGDFPPNPRLRIAARYVPMTSVAGDFYDFVLAEADRAAILVADVSGHGVPAALIASMVKLAAASQREQAHEPAKFLSGMNSALVGNTQTQFVTAACIYFDLQSREARYSAAAHPPMLHLREGKIDSVEENGLMLAAFDFAAYEQKLLPLQPGDRFLLYTDGVLEAANGNSEFFGADRLHATLRETSKLAASQAADAITAAVRAWSPNQDDDITVVVCDVV